MKLLGYILLGFNLVAGIAVVYLASQSWAKKQEQNANAMRYYLIKDGVPQDGAAIPSDATDSTVVAMPISMGKAHTVDGVTVAFLKDHFKGTDTSTYASGALPPASRIAELTRAKAAVDSAYTAKGSDAERLAFLVGSHRGIRFFPGLLVLLADTFDERQAYKSLSGELLWPTGKPRVLKADELAANAKRAKQILDAKFDAAIAAPAPGKSTDDIARIEVSKKALQAAEVDAKKVAADQKIAAAAYYAEMAAVLDPKLARRDVDATIQADFFAFIGDPKGGKPDEVKGKSQLAVERVSAAAAALQQTILGTGLTAYDDSDRKRRGTVLLQVLDPSESWQRRVALTVGLTDYLAGIQDRIKRQPDYPTRSEREKDYRTIRFFESYDRAKEQARDLDRLLSRQIEIRIALEQQAAKAKMLLAQRKGQRDAARANTEQIQATVAGLVASQDAVEKELFELQNRVGNVLQENFALEDRVIAAEKQLPTGK